MAVAEVPAVAPLVARTRPAHHRGDRREGEDTSVSRFRSFHAWTETFIRSRSLIPTRRTNIEIEREMGELRLKRSTRYGNRFQLFDPVRSVSIAFLHVFAPCVHTCGEMPSLSLFARGSCCVQQRFLREPRRALCLLSRDCRL